jgi:hypothetical protein
MGFEGQSVSESTTGRAVTNWIGGVVPAGGLSLDHNLVLVDDVSRGGRFPDADEAAHYEFLCKTAGIQVH